MTSNCTSWKYRIDLHVHTRRFSPCAETLDPEKLLHVMSQRSIHGVVIAEHDQLWPSEDIAALNRRLKHQRIYRGVEVSSKNGHFVVIGAESMNGIYPGIGIKELVKAAHELQAIVIWAHPLSNYKNLSEPFTLDQIPKELNAVEVASDVTNSDATATVLLFAQKRGWTPVSGSDAHAISQVGTKFTRFAHLPKDEKSLAAAIRDGRCRLNNE